MQTIQTIGIDLGTTYTSVSYLNDQGEPVSIPNREGELATPSVVMDTGDEVIVGTEALRCALLHPDDVVRDAKRYMGDPNKTWQLGGKVYTPVDVATRVLQKVLGDAAPLVGQIERAVITVPAQFSDRQRRATIEAGRRAGLQQVDIINEPVAASLCYVYGKEGQWFSALTDEQRFLVYDLGGGTFDLTLVKYLPNDVQIIASTGDLHLGGIDWNQRLLQQVAKQFQTEFGPNPLQDPESMQQLALEVEQCKRSLTVRPKAALIVQHAGKRKTYQIEREQFDQLTADLLLRTRELTQKLVDQHRKGSSHLDITVLATGGSSRMPMVQEMLKHIRGTTLSNELSPDTSIAHGAARYAGMLLDQNKLAMAIRDKGAAEKLAKMKQRSVTARSLGILVRDVATNQRVPYALIEPNTPLPASATKIFGTVTANQKRVTLTVVEGGTQPGDQPLAIGTCTVDQLPPNLPADSQVEVTISYDASALVEVTARELSSGRAARVQIARGGGAPAGESEERARPAHAGAGTGGGAPAAAVRSPAPRQANDDELVLKLEPEIDDIPIARPEPRPAPPVATPRPAAPLSAPVAGPPKPVATPPRPAAAPVPPSRPAAGPLTEAAIMLCPRCTEPLNARGECPRCTPKPTGPSGSVAPRPIPPAVRPVGSPAPAPRPIAQSGVPVKPPAAPAIRGVPIPPAPVSPTPAKPPAVKPVSPPVAPAATKPPANGPRPVPPPTPRPTPPPAKPGSQAKPATPAKPDSSDPGEEEFWKYIEDQ
jgi:molecular chaperone DnaK